VDTVVELPPLTSVANPRRTRLVELPAEHHEPQPASED
jgi:hypothetical protein